MKLLASYRLMGNRGQLSKKRRKPNAADENSQGKPFCEARLGMAPTISLAGSSGLDARTLRELQNAAETHREWIERSWYGCFA